MKKFCFIGLVLVVFVLSAMPLPTEALAQRAVNAKADLYHLPYGSPGTCQGYEAHTGVPDGGFVNAHINLQRDTLIFNVHVKGGLPNTTYDVFVRCIGHLGTLTTNPQGVGNATFETAAGIPSIFAIDMHTQPLGGDYASTGPITLP